MDQLGNLNLGFDSGFYRLYFNRRLMERRQYRNRFIDPAKFHPQSFDLGVYGLLG